MTEVEQLVAAVAESFRDTEYPGDDDTFEVYDPDVPHFMDVIANDRSWQAILSLLRSPDMSMGLYYGGMAAWMSAEGLHFFAPAFLTIALDRELWECADSFLSYTTPPDCEAPGFVALLSNPQKHTYALVRDYQRREFFHQGTEAAGYNVWSPWLSL